MDKPLAIVLGQICQYVYRPSDAQLAALGTPAVKLFHERGPHPTSFASTLRYVDKTVVAFQGTITGDSPEAVRDWVENFRAALKPALRLPGLVHAGFANQLSLVRDEVVDDLKSGFAPPLYVTGHSQGGAVAALATKALQLAGIRVAATHTFAAPRPGDSAFASSIETPVFRLEYGDDIVPHVPFHGLNLGPLAKVLEAIPGLPEILTRTGMGETIGYVPVGPLTYGAPGRPLRVGVSSDDEHRLALERLRGLARAKENLFAHHHLPNYIGMLVSTN